MTAMASTVASASARLRSSTHTATSAAEKVTEAAGVMVRRSATNIRTAAAVIRVRQRVLIGAAASAAIKTMIWHKMPAKVMVKSVLETRCSDCLLYTSDAADERSSVDLG